MRRSKAQVDAVLRFPDGFETCTTIIRLSSGGKQEYMLNTAGLAETWSRSTAGIYRLINRVRRNHTEMPEMCSPLYPSNCSGCPTEYSRATHNETAMPTSLAHVLHCGRTRSSSFVSFVPVNRAIPVSDTSMLFLYHQPAAGPLRLALNIPCAHASAATVVLRNGNAPCTTQPMVFRKRLKFPRL